MPRHPKLSVVIPAYNEAARLGRTLPQIVNYFTNQKYSKEIIIVDDGSTDSTANIVNRQSQKTSFLKLISLDANMGKGGAVRQGVLASIGEWVLFMDADLSTPISELDKFWTYTKDYDIIIGSRKMTGATITRRQNPLRENLGKVFTLLTNVLATKNISDITCGFKLFRGSVSRKLFKKGLLNDWSFDAEILYLAQKHHHPIKEVPVSWKNDPRSKVSLASDALNALIGLFKIRLQDIAGKY